MSSYRPSLYKLLSDNIQYDIQHYIDHAQNTNGPILELGCGTGRTIFPLSQLGIKIYGIDHDPEMLKYLTVEKERKNHKNIFLTHGCMSDFDLGQPFSMIQIPLRTIHLLTASKRKQCVDCCWQHLSPKGLLIVHYSDIERVNVDTNWRFVAEHKTTDNGYIWIEENIHIQGGSYILKHRIQQYDATSLCVGNWMVRNQLEAFPAGEFTDGGRFSQIKSYALSSTDSILVLEKQC